jgi:hypothetical protein
MSPLAGFSREFIAVYLLAGFSLLELSGSEFIPGDEAFRLGIYSENLLKAPIYYEG